MNRTLWTGLLLTGFLAAVQIAPASAASSASSNNPQFTIAPPPLAYPDYSEPGKDQDRITGQYITISGSDLSLKGFGFDFGLRHPLEPTGNGKGQGISLATGLSVLSGTVSTLDLTYVNFLVAGNYEYEAYKGNGQNAVLFAGPQLSLFSMSASGTGVDVTSSGTFIGYQLGGQYTFTAEQFKISPWGMYMSMSGTVSTDVTITGFGTTSSSSSVTVTSTAFGFDVLHTPSGVTLSSIFQATSGSDNNVHITVIQASYAFGPGVPKEQPSAADHHLDLRNAEPVASRL